MKNPRNVMFLTCISVRANVQNSGEPRLSSRRDCGTPGPMGSPESTWFHQEARASAGFLKLMTALPRKAASRDVLDAGDELFFLQ